MTDLADLAEPTLDRIVGGVLDAYSLAPPDEDDKREAVAEALGDLVRAAQAALSLLEIIDAAEVKAGPVSDLNREQLGALFNNTENALREALT